MHLDSLKAIVLFFLFTTSQLFGSDLNKNKSSTFGKVFGSDLNENKSPTFGKWKNLSPGTYIIEKRTYSGASFAPDGISYTRTILVGADESGAARFQDYSSNNPDGPWKITSAHGEVASGRLGEHIEETVLPKESIVISNQTFPCKVTKLVSQNDWGTTTTFKWIDEQSDITIKEETTYEGQSDTGQHVGWNTSLRTTGIETQRAAQIDIVCFVQEFQSNFKAGGNWARTLVSATVPGQRVAMVNSKATPPEIECELVKWGSDVALIESMKADSPYFSKERREKEEQENKRRMEEIEANLISDLLSADPQRISAAITRISQLPDTLRSSTKTAAIEALNKAWENPSIAVRRGVGLALGKLGVRGLSSKIATIQAQDPERPVAYLEALGIQGDSLALSLILKSVDAPDRYQREVALDSLRYFKEDTARIAVEKALNDPSWEVRLKAVRSLETMASPNSVSALIGTLRDTNSIVVRSAVRVIAELGDDSAAPALLELLKTSEKELQSTVCLYVGKLHLKHPEVVGNALLPIVESSQSEIQEAAILSIAALRERRAIPSLVKIINSPIDPQSKTMWGLPIQITAIVALGEIRDSSAIPTLLELLDHEIYAERAIEALIKIGEPAAAKGLFERYIEPLNDKDHRLRGKIIEAVGKLGDEEMRAKLESHLAQCLPPQKGSIRAAIRNINERYPR